MIFNKKEQEKNMKTIKINRKYQEILILITFDELDNFSEGIHRLLNIDNSNDEVEVTISEVCYLKLKVIMHEKGYKNFNELFKNLLC